MGAGNPKMEEKIVKRFLRKILCGSVRLRRVCIGEGGRERGREGYRERDGDRDRERGREGEREGG